MRLEIKPKHLAFAIVLGVLGWIAIGAMILGWCYALPGACS